MSKSKLRVLTANERVDLDRLEETVTKGLATAIATAKTLLEIKDRELYKAHCLPWERYVAEKWGISRQHSYLLLDAARTLASLKVSCAHDTPMPESVRAASALGEVRDGQQRSKLWESLCAKSETVPDGPEVEAAVADLLAGKTEQERQRLQQGRRERKAPAGEAKIDVRFSRIERARRGLLGMLQKEGIAWRALQRVDDAEDAITKIEKAEKATSETLAAVEEMLG